MKKLTFAACLLWATLSTSCVKDLDADANRSADHATAAEKRTGLPDPDEGAFVPGELLVKFRPGASAAARANVLGLIGGKLKEHVLTDAMKRSGDAEGFHVVAIPMGVLHAMDRIKKLADVAYAEPNFIYRLPANVSEPDINDPYYASPDNLWGMMGMLTTPYENQYASRAAEAWWDLQQVDGVISKGRSAPLTGSRKVYVAVIDQGVDDDNADFIRPDGTVQVDVANGRDFVSGDNDPDPSSRSEDHGTHVAGTIGAVGNNTIGVAGVCWEVGIISVRFLNERGSGTAANAARAIDYVTSLRTQKNLFVVASNNSWGGLSSRAISDAIARANTAGIMFVAAAGNDNRNNDATPVYPASYSHSNIISVASLMPSGARSGFSNWGKTSVDLAAPGSYIWSTVPLNCFSDDDRDGQNNGIGWMSGTSMAAPHVTGAIALWVAAHDTNNDGALDAAITGTNGATLYAAGAPITDEMIKDMLFRTVRPTTTFQNLCVTNGRLDVPRFIKDITTALVPD